MGVAVLFPFVGVAVGVVLLALVGVVFPTKEVKPQLSMSMAMTPS